MYEHDSIQLDVVDAADFDRLASLIIYSETSRVTRSKDVSNPTMGLAVPLMDPDNIPTIETFQAPTPPMPVSYWVAYIRNRARIAIQTDPDTSKLF